MATRREMGIVLMVLNMDRALVWERDRLPWGSADQSNTDHLENYPYGFTSI